MSFTKLWGPAPPPPTKLGRHRQLSALAGIHVSPFCLGGMSIGDKWAQHGFGAMDKESSFKLLDAFYDAGGNFVDTANNYQDESSEEFIGEWMESRGVRDQMVIATKYSTMYVRAKDDIKQKTQYVGNSMKSMHISIEDSLKKLRTSYIDILFVHFWDYTTSIPEVMNGLHALVMSGKVLYLGISNAPAWIVSRANEWARCNAKTPFSVYQGQWSILKRDFERDIIPMARAEGMALVPWDVLGGGKIRSDEQEQQREKTGENGRTLFSPEWRRTEEQRRICKVLEDVAAEIGAKTIQAVAIAYVMQKTPYVFPILGGRKVEHLHSNIEALDVVLTTEHISKIEAVVPFDSGFPVNFMGDGTAYNVAWNTSGQYDKWPLAQAIRPTDL